VIECCCRSTSEFVLHHREQRPSRHRQRELFPERGWTVDACQERSGAAGSEILQDHWQGLRHSEDHMEILGVEKLGSTIIQPLGASQRMAFWAVAISAGNGRRPLAALWADPVMGSWRRRDCARAPVAANPAHHYEARLRSAISLSDSALSGG
jgi:hypothetical protein